MRPALTAAVLALLALAGCGDEPEPAAPEATATIMVVDQAEPAPSELRRFPDEGYDNVVEVQGDGPEWREVEGSVEVAAGAIRLRAYAVDRFAGPNLRRHEPCAENLVVERTVVVWVSRDYAGSCEIETDPRLCPALGEKANEAALRERAQLAFLGMPFEEAEALADGAGCDLAAAQIDGEPQPLTREYDPTRIQVNLHDNEVQKVLGFG